MNRIINILNKNTKEYINLFYDKYYTFKINF